MGSGLKWNERAVCSAHTVSEKSFERTQWKETEIHIHVSSKGPKGAPRVAAASKKAPAALGNIGRGWEEERLSGDYCGEICHWCTKGQERRISNQDVAISNLASRRLKLGLAAP